MMDGVDPLAGFAINRRALMTLVGALIANAALDGCSSHAAISPGATAASSPAGNAATAGTPARSLSLAYPVPVDTARLQVLANTYNGNWSGNWAEESGATGKLGATITIDPPSRRVKATFSFTGAFLQGGAGPTELIDLTIPDGSTPENLDVPLALTGEATYTYEGGTTAVVSAASLPGNSDALNADLALAGDTVTASYSVVAASGQTLLGAAIAARNRVPDPIDLAAIARDRLNASLFSGRYAADLLTPQQASTAVGTQIRAVLPNGGNLRYATGMTTSNTNAKSTDGTLVIQITVYRAVDLATMNAFWATSVRGLGPQVAGFGNEAVEYPVSFYMLAGTLAASIEVVKLGQTPLPVDKITAQHNLAAAMLPSMLHAR